MAKDKYPRFPAGSELADQAFVAITDGEKIYKGAKIADFGGGGGASGLPSGYLTGFNTAINSGNPDEQIDFGIGACRDEDDTYDIRVTTGLTKDITATWVAGDGNGGRSSSTAVTPNTWFYLFVIANSATGDVDFGFDVLLNAAGILADSGYDKYRRIGAIRIDSSSDIEAYTQYGNTFRFVTPQIDYDAAPATTNEEPVILTTPLNIAVEAILTTGLFQGGTNNVRIYSPDDADFAPSSAIRQHVVQANSQQSENEIRVQTNTSSVINYRATSASGSLRIVTSGWVDPRADFTTGGTGQIQRATSSEYCPGYTYTFVDTDTWRITGIDASNLFNVGRRLKFIDGSSTYFGTVTAVNFTGGNTDIDMSMESGDVLTNSITEVCLVTGATAWSPITADPFGGTAIRAIATGAIAGTQWWVIVGDAGRLATSTDGGLNWILRSTGLAEDFTDVAYSSDNETFIAVANDGRCRRTSDGATWADPGDWNAEVTTGTGRSFITFDLELSKWLVLSERLAANYASYSAADSASMTWVRRENGVSSNVRDLNYYAWTSAAVQNCYYAIADDLKVLDNADDTADQFVYSNLGAQAHCEIGVYDGVTLTDRVLIGLDTGDIYQDDINGGAGGTFTDTVTFTAQLNAMAYSPLHNRVVVVGNDANLGYLPGNDTEVADNWTFVASGFGPLVNILDVAWNETDGVFVAVGADGSICRSSNGTN